MSSPPEDRLDELESRLAFQDDLIEQLNEVVTRQDRELSQLKEMVRLLSEQVQSLAQTAPAGGGEQHEVPPHY